MKLIKVLTAVLILSISALFISSCSDDDPSSPSNEHFEPEGWVFIDAAQQRFMTIWQGQFDAGSATKFELTVGEMTDHIDVEFLDADKDEIDAPDDDHYSLSWQIADETIVEVHQDDGDEGEFEFHLKGLKQGTTEIEFMVMHGDHADVRTIKIPVEVN
jgi:hypothetical protein